MMFREIIAASFENHMKHVIHYVGKTQSKGKIVLVIN
jgi:hypothetical protein